MRCTNHSLNLVVVTMFAIANAQIAKPLNIVNDCYALALFLRMGGHFLRLLTSTRAHIRARFAVVRRDAPLGADDYHAEFIAYLVTNAEISKASEGEEKSAKGARDRPPSMRV